jgi:putative peptide zinc metalloprotease protein
LVPSASSAFPDKRDRALVAAAGMGVELFLAGLAMFVWLLAEPGLLRAVAFNTMLVAGVSTLVFNGNPLLRYDGYYVLSDILDIPNLLQRANGQLTYLVKRWLLGMKQVRPVTRSKREQVWLLAYAIASWTYRLIVFPAILLFVSQQFFGLGVLLTAAAFIAWVLVPLGKFVHFLATDPGLNQTRWRAVAVCGGGALAAIGIISLLPLPEPPRPRSNARRRGQPAEARCPRGRESPRRQLRGRA